MTGRSIAPILAAVLLIAPTVSIAQPTPPVIIDAQFTDPTTRYPHGALGDDEEWGGLAITIAPCPDCAPEPTPIYLPLPQTRVFEDTAPRLADLDGDGSPEVIVVETDRDRGASLAVYDETGKVAATPFIGTTHRWLAPLGAADLDGDGLIEIAYVDRPHLARILRVWRFVPDGVGGGALLEIANADGHTNHRFGSRQIEGGIADCGAGPEIVTASPDWSRVLLTRLENGRLVTRAAGTLEGALAPALAC